MPLQGHRTDATEFDEEGIEWVVERDGDDVAWETMAKRGAAIIDASGRRAEVSDYGALKVVGHAGPPIMLKDAAGEDAFLTLIVAPRDFHNMLITVTSFGVTIGLNGQDAWAVDDLAVGNSVVIPNICIPKGTAVQAKNSVAGSAYTNLYLSLW